MMITFIERKKTCLEQDCRTSRFSSSFGKQVSRYTCIIFCTYSVYTKHVPILMLQFQEEEIF